MFEKKRSIDQIAEEESIIEIRGGGHNEILAKRNSQKSKAHS